MNKPISLFENDRPPVVQEKKKYANFTVSVIGGPNEIIAWRQRQAEKEAMNQTVRLQKLETAKQRMTADLPDDDGVTENRASFTLAADPRTWAEKQAAAKQRMAEFMKPEILEPKAFEPWAAPTEPKKSLFQRFKSWIRGFWDSAQF